MSEFVAKIDAVNIVSHDYNDRMYELIGSCIVGWDNIIDPDTGEAIEYSPKALQSVLTVGERAELLSQLIYQGPTADELKNCDSPSRSSAAASAKAVRGRKPAKTRRRK